MLGTYESLRLSALRFPEKLAVRDDQGSYTYRRFRELANRIGNALLSLGLQKGDRVALYARNCAEVLASYYALERNGMVAVPINYSLVGPEVEYLLTHARVEAVLVGDGLVSEMIGAREHLGLQTSRCIVLGEAPVADMSRFADLLANTHDAEVRTLQQPSDIEAIFYTSGTTGSPKGTIRTRVAQDWIRVSHIIEWGFAHEDTNYCVGPLFHNSFLGIAQMHIALGATVIVQNGWDPERAIDTIARTQTSTAFLVPTMCRDLVDLPDGIHRRFDLSHFRTLISSGAPLPTDVKEQLLSALPDLFLNEGYGWTEVMFATNLRPSDQMRKIRCVGKPLLGVRVEVLGPDGEPLSYGQPGDVYARMATPFAGYFGDSERTRLAQRRDLITGGDIGQFDDEGYLYILDRKHDLIISGGENIYPTEIEEVLASHPKVLESAVIGLPDQRLGDRCLAVVVLRPNLSASQEELIQFCNGRLARFKWPRTVVFVNTLPRNTMGKLLRRELRTRFAGDT